MKVLIATSFYAEYELCETENLEELKEYAKNMAYGIETEPPKDCKFLGTHDDISTADAIAQADETIWIDEF